MLLSRTNGQKGSLIDQLLRRRQEAEMHATLEEDLGRSQSNVSKTHYATVWDRAQQSATGEGRHELQSGGTNISLAVSHQCPKMLLGPVPFIGRPVMCV